MKPYVHLFPIVSPAPRSLRPGALRVGPRAAAQATLTHSRLPQKQPPTHFLPLQSNKALFSLVLSLPAVWFQSQGCHIRQLSLSNSICGERSSRCTTADMQVLKSPPTLVLICSQLKGIESNKDCSIRASMKHEAETHRS